MKLLEIGKKWLVYLPAAVAIFALITPQTSLALTMPTILTDNGATNFTSVGNIISFIFNALIIVGAVVVFVMFAIGGIMYLTGAGNDEQTGKAKKMLIDAIIGFAIVLAAFALSQFVLKLFIGSSNVLDSVVE